jgi:hypothetical protein
MKIKKLIILLRLLLRGKLSLRGVAPLEAGLLVWFF